jgi:hypothetical protein
MAKGVENVTSPFSSEKLSVDAFAEGIKANYPEYKEVDNNSLTKAILEKYPEYESKVETPYTNEEARDVREKQEQERKKKIFTESSSAGETQASTAELQAGDKLASYTQQLDSKLNQAQPTEKDFFTGTFGNILKGFDKIIPIGLGDWIDDMGRAAVAGHFQGIAAENSSDLLKAGNLATHEEIQEFLKANEKAASLGASAEMQEFTRVYEENGEGMKGVVMGLLESGVTIVPELILSSLVSMFSNTDALAAGGTAIGLGAARGAAVGSTAGGVGAAPGAVAGAAAAIPYAFGAASAALEAGATFAELLQEEAGENVRLDEAKVKEILNDKEAYTRIRNKAVVRGVTIGVIDTITGKLGGSASKLITARSAAKSASGVVSKKGFTQATAASTLIEGIGGSAGEATARAAIGQEMDVSEIALEGIAELPMGIRNVVTTQISSPKYYVNGKRVNAETVDSLIETMIPEDLAEADIVIKNDFEGRQNKIDEKVKKYKVSSEVKKSSPNLSDKQVEEVTNLQTELDSLEGKKSEASKKRSSEIKEKINEILENPEGATTPPAKKKKTKPAPEETTDEEAIEELNKEGKAATKENIEEKKKEKFVQAQVITAEEADAMAEEADAQAPVTTDAQVITAEEADAMSVKLPNGNEYVIDSKGNITNKKSGKAIKRTSVTGKSVLKASKESKVEKPATPKKTTKKPAKTKQTPKQTQQEQTAVPEDSEAVTSADMSVLNLVLKDAKEGQVEELNGKKYTVKNGEIVNSETGKKVVVGTPATKKATPKKPAAKKPATKKTDTKKPATKKTDTKAEEKPKEVSYRNNVYLVNPDGTITNKKTGKSINPKSVTGKAVLKKLSETEKTTKKPTTKKSKTKEAKVEEKKEATKKTDTKKIEQAKRKNEKINESAPRSKYKRLKVELLRTANGYTTVVEKTDKRTKKVTRYEFDIFVNAKTGAVTHSVTEFVDGKKKDTKELKDAKGFIDAVNKRVASGAVVSKSFQSQVDAQVTRDKQKSELERVVPFKEKKEKTYTKRITKYTYKNSKGEEVVVTITSYTGQKERGMPAAKITFSDKRKDTEIGSKQQLDVFVGKLKRRNNIKVELVSESKKTIGATETLSEDLKSTEPILPEVAKKSKRKPRAKKLPSNVKPFKRTIVKARTDFEPAVFKILLPDGSEVFFQKQIDGKIQEVKVIEGTRDEYGAVKDSKSYDSIREAISDFKKKSEAETKAETKPAAKKPAAKKPAAKKPAAKKPAETKKTFKEIAKEKKDKEKAEVNDEVNQIENEIEYLDSENVNLNEEIQIEKGNISEAKKAAREKIAKVKKSKKSAAKKAEAIEEIKAELQDEVDDLNGNIENYKEDLKANNSEIKKLQRQKAKAKEKGKKKVEAEKAKPISKAKDGSRLVYEINSKTYVLELTDDGSYELYNETDDVVIDTYDKKSDGTKAVKKLQERKEVIDAVNAYNEASLKNEERKKILERLGFKKMSLTEGYQDILNKIPETKKGKVFNFLQLITKEIAILPNSLNKFLSIKEDQIDFMSKSDINKLKNLQKHVKEVLQPASKKSTYAFMGNKPNSKANKDYVKAYNIYVDGVQDIFNKYMGKNLGYKIESQSKERSRLLTDEEVDATIENEQVKESVNRARRILKLFSPNVRIVIHQSRKAFDEAMARESVNGVASGVEAGRYIQNKNTGVKEIHINLENATATTAIHEAFHAFFDTAYGQDPNIARALAGRLYSALRRGGVEDRRIAFKLQNFIKQYKDVDVQSEEMLAELAAIMSESNAVLSKPVIIKLANLIKDFLIATAKKLKIDNRLVRLLEFEQKQRMEEAEAIEFMKSFVNAVEDSSVNPLQNPIASMPQFKSQDYDLKDMLVEMSNLTENTENEIGGMVVDFFEKGQIIKKAIKNGQITTGHKLEELNNKMFLMHQPDNAAVNTIRDNKGKTIGNAFGGVLFPLKFEGAFWASTRAKAQEMADQLNTMLKLDGKIRMVLTAAPLDKLLSSTVVARNVSSVLNNYADRLNLSERNRLKIQRTKYENLFKVKVNYFDRYSDLNLKSKTQKLTNSEKKTLRERRALYNSMEKVGLIEVKELKNGKLKLIKKKFKTSEEYESRFDTLLDPDNSTFDTRKLISTTSTTAFVQELSYVQNRKLSEILELGYTKTGTPVALRNTELQAAIQKMHTEPLIMKIEAGMAYAILETDSAVEAVEVTGEGMHPSYPFQIRLKDSSKSVKVKFLEKPQNPVQGKIYDLSKDVDFNVNDYFDNENSYKNIRDTIFPTSGVSQPVIFNGDKSKISNVNEAYQELLDESQLKDRAKRKKENEKALSGYSKERSQMTTKERSQFKEEAVESDSVEQPAAEQNQGNTPQEKNKIAKIKSAKDLFVFLKETFVRAREFTKSTGLAYTETQKNIRSFLEAMNSQLSRTAFRVRLQGRMLRKLADSPEKLKLVEDYLVAEPNEKQAIREQIEKLEKGSKILAVADGMRSYIDSMSEKFLNSPYFDSLPEVASKKVESYVVQKGKNKGETKYRVVNTKTGEVLAADLTKAAAEKQQQQAGIKDIIRNNLGSYLHTSYRFFSDSSFKITDKSKKAAIQGQYEAVRAEKIKELMDDGMTEKEAIESLKDPKLITEMQELATKQIEDYIRKIEEVRADPKFKVLGLNAASAKIPKPAFQRKKGLPDYIENMLGIEKDPVNRFVNSALVMAQTFYKAQLVHKISQSVGEDYVKDSITDAEAASGNWKLVKDKYSPLGGKYVQVEIFEMLQSKPLLSSDNLFFDGYFKGLKLMRKSKVIWNIPTWRKNWFGGWFFMAANGVINKKFAQDTKNRADRLLKGMSNPEIEALLDEMAENGLIGADVNAGLIDLNDAAMGMMFSDEELGTIESKYKKLFNKMKNADSKLAEKYAAVDDYSKLIIYRVERESFAKKLFGKQYSELTEKQQAEVRKQAAEFVKQNTPTFSRLPKWYTRGRVAGKEISFAQLPLGDFLGFRLESIRSLFANVMNAVADLKKARTDTSLNDAQKAEYKAAGQRRMAGSMSILAMRMAIPVLFAKMALDEEDEELQDDAVRLRPSWMEGHTLLVKSISDEGIVKVYDYSMEDPYAEVIDMTSGDLTIFEDFTKPNMLVKLITHLTEGKDAYGRDLYEKADPKILKMSKFLGYTMKQVVVPPSFSALVKYKNPTHLGIRDYEINIGQQFYFQAKEYVSTKKYYELEGRARKNRLTALDEVREMYQAVMNVAVAKNNPKMMQSASRVLNRFGKREKMYIMYGIEV